MKCKIPSQPYGHLHLEEFAEVTKFGIDFEYCANGVNVSKAGLYRVIINLKLHGEADVKLFAFLNGECVKSKKFDGSSVEADWEIYMKPKQGLTLSILALDDCSVSGTFEIIPAHLEDTKLPPDTYIITTAKGDYTSGPVIRRANWVVFSKDLVSCTVGLKFECTVIVGKGLVPTRRICTVTFKKQPTILYPCSYTPAGKIKPKDFAAMYPKIVKKSDEVRLIFNHSVTPPGFTLMLMLEP